MTRVALINCGKDTRFSSSEPLHLGSLASYLEMNGIEVAIIDELSGQNVRLEIAQFKPDIIGLTATTPLVDDAYRIAEKYKAQGVLTVMGGVHASVYPEEALKHVDVVVVGEGERAFLDIIKENIRAGVVSRPIINNLDEIPRPARHLMNMEYYLNSAERFHESYLYFVPPQTKVASIFTSRGCPYSCIYCHNTWRGTPFRFNSVDRVILEIKRLVKDYGVGAIFFIEDNLFVNKKRLRAICQRMKEERLDIVWAGNARVDNIDLEILKIAQEAGCRQITFGFESGSQRILDVLNKKTTVEQNKRAVALCKQAGLLVNGTFMIGSPTETLADIEATRKFIAENPIDRPGICITTPFPGTELWNWCEQKHLIPNKFKWSDFTYDKIPFPACDTLSRQEIMGKYDELVALAYKNAPINLNRFWQQPLVTAKKLARYLRSPGKWSKLLKRVRF